MAKKPKKITRYSYRPELLILVALLFIALISVLGGRKGATEQKIETVAVASEDDVVLIPTPLRSIAKGEKLQKVPFARTKWPKSQVNQKYIKSTEGYAKYVALTALPANLPIPVSAIAKSGSEGNAVIDSIPREMRAISIRVDDESAVEGWARPGDFVDVILLRQSKDSDIGIEAKVIAENVKILSAGKSAERSQNGRTPATVTVLVDQEHALKVKAAANIGKLTFALRAGGDNTPTLAKRMDQRALLGNARASLPRSESYRGKARGPDGKIYLLSNQSKWIKKEKVVEKVIENGQQ